jgi:hypothetical protein
MNIPSILEQRPTIKIVRAFGERDSFQTDLLDRPTVNDDQLLDSGSGCARCRH